ncbi:MBL fold metallo-hydrolase [Desulfocurvus vexinensis]|uniref:MBL fold metallo-hydrolase n=1 Tax=Desulfocurvus vexinensis TaxID=399548 RepID=UPI00049147B6|nr:MBL fold metallo-hydrolase [Desulfocurvus vexinensis]
MKVTVWGCRGSLPVSTTAPTIRRKVAKALRAAARKSLGPGADVEAFIDSELPFSVHGSYGSNTCCVQVDGGGEATVIVDCGSGLRDLGNAVISTRGPSGGRYDFLMTHLHWDHLMGFPFFTPAYVPGNVIRFHGCHEAMERALRTQQSPPFFPVGFDDLGADIAFNTLIPGRTTEIGGMAVTPFAQNHPGGSYGYRFEAAGKCFVMSTDSEHREDAEADDYPFLEHVRGADLMIFDAQYTFQAASTSKKDWGHSSNIVGVELAKRAGVRALCLFHQEPTLDDASIEAFHDETRRYAGLFMPETPLEVLMAYDGMVVEV